MTIAQGFDIDAVRKVRGESGGSGLGLFNMAERLQMIGGTLTLDSTPGGGTKVVLDLPARGGGRHFIDGGAHATATATIHQDPWQGKARATSAWRGTRSDGRRSYGGA